ncbi:SDR family oxidoreductase [Jatrophihabitans sp.]|jgi:3-oxoacyl-[acyl-carrier protein] reductase|uniref:SDR family oxidoreductase n=1 Tax=Jatrophihabitans sp. TaxID=1932789 RepID=UPI002F252BED
MNRAPDLAEEVMVVTGAARGLGHEITLELLERGAQVVAGCSGDPAPLELLAEKWPGQVWPVVGDIGEEETSVRLIAQAARLGGPTAILHNAAISRDSLLVRTTIEEWEDVQRVNLGGAFLLSKHAVRAMMRARRGRLVYISSISAVLGNAGQASYAASKAGLDGLSRSISQEYARYGIQSCVLAAGLIDVGLGARLGEQDQQAKLSRVLLGAAQPRDMARIAAFLASPAANYINATTVRADGGVRF